MITCVIYIYKITLQTLSRLIVILQVTERAKSKDMNVAKDTKNCNNKKIIF